MKLSTKHTILGVKKVRGLYLSLLIKKCKSSDVSNNALEASLFFRMELFGAFEQFHILPCTMHRIKKYYPM